MTSLRLFALFLVCMGETGAFNEWTGVAFSPYTKTNANWNDYSYDDVKAQLRTVGSKFKWISTYSMGVNQWNKNSRWDQRDANCLVARAAADLNMGLKVSIGVYQNEGDRDIENKEIQGAFDAAQDANNRRSGTVWGVVFTNEYVVDQGKGQRVLGMIRNNKNRGLKVGTRIHVCGAILDNGHPLNGVLRDIARESHFIMCNTYPDQGVCRNGDVAGSIRGIDDFFKRVQRRFKEINPNIEVMIGETGWASEGETFNHCQNNVNNLKNFWWGMGSWAEQNRVRTHMFEAIDEPWKGNESGEKKFGWWYREGNGSPPKLVEKAARG